jgi:hypothetical protein
VSNPNGAADYRLNLPDFSVDNLALVPNVGVEWAFGDRMNSPAFFTNAERRVNGAAR